MLAWRTITPKKGFEGTDRQGHSTGSKETKSCLFCRKNVPKGAGPAHLRSHHGCNNTNNHLMANCTGCPLDATDEMKQEYNEVTAELQRRFRAKQYEEKKKKADQASKASA